MDTKMEGEKSKTSVKYTLMIWMEVEKVNQ